MKVTGTIGCSPKLQVGTVSCSCVGGNLARALVKGVSQHRTWEEGISPKRGIIHPNLIGTERLCPERKMIDGTAVSIAWINAPSCTCGQVVARLHAGLIQNDLTIQKHLKSSFSTGPSGSEVSPTVQLIIVQPRFVHDSACAVGYEQSELISLRA
eukprot:362778-Prymnesium_polylepis.2